MRIAPSKILVVDDEPEIGWLFGRVLGEDGYQVLTAETGEEALAAFSGLLLTVAEDGTVVTGHQAL